VIPRAGSVGKSFKGAYLYYMNDKADKTNNLNQQGERVDWTGTLNLHTDNPKHALVTMIDTANHADQLKAESGQKKGGEKAKNTVYTYSLSWAEQQNPTRKEMMATAQSSLKALGFENRQALVIAHNDEAYKHIHIMVNRVNPETGMIEHKKTTSKDYIKLSEWAEKYERDTGQIVCLERERNNAKRKKGDWVKYDDDGTHREAKHEANKAFSDQSWKEYKREKSAAFKKLVEHKRRAIKTRLDACKKKQNFKGKWSEYYSAERTYQKKQGLANKNNVRILKNVLANKYGAYRANI
jgi:hypothetical protein